MLRRFVILIVPLLILVAGFTVADARDLEVTIKNEETDHPRVEPAADPICLYYEDFQEGTAGWVAKDISWVDHDPRWNQATYATLGVMWCGVTNPAYPGGSGYGNNWNELLRKQFVLPAGTPSLSYDIQYDSEYGEDYTYVKISTDGGSTWSAPLVSHTGVSAGFEPGSVDLSAYAGQTVHIGFQFYSDNTWSDEDNLYTSDGACRLDWVQVSGFPRDNFTAGSDGWASPLPARYDGGFRLVAEPVCSPGSTLPCDMYCNAWVAYDEVTGLFPSLHNIWPYDVSKLRLAIESPIITLPGDATNYTLRFDVFADLPLNSLVFYYWQVAAPAPEFGGTFRTNNFVYHSSGGHFRTTYNITPFVTAGATTMRIRLVAYDRFPYLSYSGAPHTPAPFFDNVQITALGTASPGIDCSGYPRYCDHGYTPPGEDVVVNPIDPTTGTQPVTLTFANIATPGSTSVTTGGTGNPPPEGFRLGSPPTYYDIQTTATFNGDIQICIDYGSTVYQNEPSLKLMHLEGGAWVDRTTSLDTEANRVCGTVASLSPFVIVEESPPNQVSPGPSPSCIDLAHACVTIPVTIARSTADEIRGFSVDVQLSSNLQLCGAGITEGDYLSNAGETVFHVIDNTGGSYTIDCAILGEPCGQDDPAGQLFQVPVGRVSSDGIGTITVTRVALRDCNNAAVVASSGPPLSITIDTVPPVVVGDLVATQVKSGNGSDGTTRITLTWSAPGDAVVTRVYRAPWGGYPEYDDAGFTSPPPVPSYPPGLPWALTGVTASGQDDEPLDRDFWYYVVFTWDACGNRSAVSNRTGGTLNYHLGDTHNGSTNCAGNNVVDGSDISFMGAHYGATLGYPDTLACLDIGPTTDYSVDARPTTDNRIQFEDLMIFAMNHGQVGKPVHPVLEKPTSAQAVWLEVAESHEVGSTFLASLRLDGGGRIQGISLDLDYDRAVVRPEAVEAGELMTRQGTSSVVLSSGRGNVDAAVFGPGQTIRGDGELARVTFRRIGAGESAVTIARAEARDVTNRPVNVVVNRRNPTPEPASDTFLGANYPNPVNGRTIIPLGLKATGPVRLSIFDVRGRLVRTLHDGVLPAGARVVEWDGHDGHGQAAPSGYYVIRLEVAGTTLTRSIRVIR